MSMCTQYLDSGYQKLYRQATSELRRLGAEAYPEVNRTLRKTIEHLRDRPDLFQYVCQSYKRAGP